MSTRTSSRQRANWTLWAGPLAWAAHLGANFALGPVTCFHDTRLYLWLISLFAFSISGYAGWAAWTVRRELRDAEPADRDATDVEFLALCGLGMSVLSMVVIFAQSLPTFVFGPCQ